MLNKFSLVGMGMQLLEKYKENFDVSSEGPPSGGPLVTTDEGPYSLETSNPPYIFQVVASPPTKACLYY
jgi:hypothetical protein